MGNVAYELSNVQTRLADSCSSTKVTATPSVQSTTMLIQYLRNPTKSFGCGSKPMGSHFGVGEFATHFRTYFSGGLGCSLGVAWPFRCVEPEPCSHAELRARPIALVPARGLKLLLQLLPKETFFMRCSMAAPCWAKATRREDSACESIPNLDVRRALLRAKQARPCL